jgi:hypothetical protein
MNSINNHPLVFLEWIPDNRGEKMNKKLLIPILILMLASLACQFGATSKTTPTGGSSSNAGQLKVTVVKSSGVVKQVIMASNTAGDLKDPVGPTDIFGKTATVHAVVQIDSAPSNTVVGVAWYVVDVGSAAPAGQLIDQTSLTTDGTRNLDFTLKPDPSLPEGTYKVDISINQQIDQTVIWYIK